MQGTRFPFTLSSVPSLVKARTCARDPVQQHFFCIPYGISTEAHVWHITQEHTNLMNSRTSTIYNTFCWTFYAAVSLRADEIKLWLTPSAKQRRNPCSGLAAVYPDLSTRHDWPVKKGLCFVCRDRQSRWRGIRNALPVIRWVRWGPDQGSLRCFADGTNESLVIVCTQATRLYDCKSYILNSIYKLVTENDFFSCLLYRHECFTRKYATRKIHKNYIRDPSGLFSRISHVSLSMT